MAQEVENWNEQKIKKFKEKNEQTQEDEQIETDTVTHAK